MIPAESESVGNKSLKAAMCCNKLILGPLAYSNQFRVELALKKLALLSYNPWTLFSLAALERRVDFEQPLSYS